MEYLPFLKSETGPVIVLPTWRNDRCLSMAMNCWRTWLIVKNALSAVLVIVLLNGTDEGADRFRFFVFFE